MPALHCQHVHHINRGCGKEAESHDKSLTPDNLSITQCASIHAPAELAYAAKALVWYSCIGYEWFCEDFREKKMSTTLDLSAYLHGTSYYAASEAYANPKHIQTIRNLLITAWNATSTQTMVHIPTCRDETMESMKTSTCRLGSSESGGKNVDSSHYSLFFPQ